MLVLSFFIVFFYFFIFGILLGKLKISVKDFNYEMVENIENKRNFNIYVGLYLFGNIKCFGIIFKENGIRILGSIITYEQIKNSKFFKKVMKEDVIQFDKKALKNNIEILNFNLEKINLNLKFGTDSTLITSFITFAASTILSLLIQKSITKYNRKKHKFIITPIYENKTSINVFLELVLSLNLSNIIKFVFELNNLSKAEHNKNKVKFKEIKI